MANTHATTLELAFEQFVESYDAMCAVSRAVETSYPSPQAMQRAGDVFYVRQNYHSAVVTGLDVSAATATDVIDRFVPVTYRTPDNVVIYLDAKELRDPIYMTKQGQSAAKRLAAEIEKNLMTEIGLRANIVQKKVGAITWDDGATAEAVMLSRGITADGRNLAFNPFDWQAVAKDLGNRAYIGDLSKDAYENSRVPAVAGFSTFRTDSLYNLAAAGTVSGTTVNANTSHTPSSMTSGAPTDNRVGALVVAGANIANIKNGDRFTIANVNACHMIDKSDTGQPLTFTVISGAGTANLVVSPQIVITGPYQNATAQAAAGAALTFLNTATKPINPFWQDGALRLDYGKLAFPEGQGANVMTATTKQGVPLVQVSQIDAATGKLFVRWTTLYAVTAVDPEKVGFIIANQT